MDVATAKASEVAALVGKVDPVSLAPGSASTAWVSAKDFHVFMGVVSAGILGAAATLDGKIEQATDGAGAGAKDVTGKTTTQLVKATDDDSQAIVNVRPEDLDVENGFAWIRLTLTVAGAASLVDGALFGFGPRYAPAAQAASVKGNN